MNSKLHKARKEKNDEFYTRYEDIEAEVFSYYEKNENVFRGKTILLPCDDPDWSNFTKFFIDNFDKFGIKKLISSCFVKDSKGKLLIKDNYETKRQLLNVNGDFRSDEVTKLRDEADMIITNPPFSLFREFLAWVTSIQKNHNETRYERF